MTPWIRRWTSGALALFFATLPIVFIGYAAVMFDRAARGYQDSSDRVYVSVAAVSLLLGGALAFAAWRLLLDAIAWSKARRRYHSDHCAHHRRHSFGPRSRFLERG